MPGSRFWQSLAGRKLLDDIVSKRIPGWVTGLKEGQREAIVRILDDEDVFWIQRLEMASPATANRLAPSVSLWASKILSSIFFAALTTVQTPSLSSNGLAMESAVKS